MIDLKAIRARNEERKERFLDSAERALVSQSKLEPDFAIPDIDALLAEVERLRAGIDAPTGAGFSGPTGRAALQDRLRDLIG